MGILGRVWSRDDFLVRLHENNNEENNSLQQLGELLGGKKTVS